MAPELRSAVPAKEDNLSYDLKNLCAADISPVDLKTLEDTTRDNVQLLVNQLFQLPTEKDEEGIFAELPGLEAWHMPREKHVPKQKAMTRWEKFAQEKGIQKKKRGRMVWNEQVKDWVPRWGFGSTKQIEEKHDWVIEAKAGQDPNEDPFQKRKMEKKLVQAKQKMREVRNMAESLGEKVPAGVVGMPNRVEKRGKANLKESLRRAQTSSASIGKFDKQAKGERTVRNKGEKKQFMIGNEKEATVKLAERVLKGEKLVDNRKAANYAIHKQEKERAAEKVHEPERKKRRKQ